MSRFEGTSNYIATKDLRVVFILDVRHPDLTAAERAAVAALIGSECGAAGSTL